jgi:hypothetical protein
MNTRRVCMAMILTAAACTGGPLHAQLRDTVASGAASSTFRPVTLSGEIGAYGELYTMSGREARRPSSIGRLFFRPTLTLFDALSLGFDVLVSTEGTSARQDINQFGLNPTWSWGRAHAGDFTDTYAQYTLNGIRIRGGGFFINPGLFRLGAVGGVTRRAVMGGADNGAFDRYLWGGRIGIGSSEGSAFDIVFLRIRDKISSLPSVAQNATFDSTTHLYTTPAFETTPQENALLGVMSHITMLEGHVTWDMEATGSIFTRDMRVDQNKELNIPAWINDFYRVNMTSSAGVAVRSDVGVTAGNVSVNAGYRYVTPGYTSLGVASLINDWQEFSLAPSVRFGRWSLQWTAIRQNDNLFGQKLNTLVRWQNGGTVTLQPADRWSASIFGNYLTMGNDAVNDTFKVSYGTLTLGSNQYIMFAEGAAVQAVMVNYLYQRSANESPLGPGTKFTSHSGNMGITIPITQTLSLLPGAGIVVSWASRQTAQTTQTYSLAAQHRAMENALVSVLSGVMSVTGGSSSFRSMLSSTYRLTTSASIGLTVSMMNYRSDMPYGGRFDELSASVYLTQRF